MNQREVEKRERFARLAEARVQKASDALRLVGNLANKANYSYDEEDAKQILDFLNSEVKKLQELFRTSGSKSEQGFKLRRGK
jgi:hypothetical protein